MSLDQRSRALGGVLAGIQQLSQMQSDHALGRLILARALQIGQGRLRQQSLAVRFVGGASETTGRLPGLARGAAVLA